MDGAERALNAMLRERKCHTRSFAFGSHNILSGRNCYSPHFTDEGSQGKMTRVTKLEYETCPDFLMKLQVL